MVGAAAQKFEVESTQLTWPFCFWEKTKLEYHSEEKLDWKLWKNLSNCQFRVQSWKTGRKMSIHMKTFERVKTWRQKATGIRHGKNKRNPKFHQNIGVFRDLKWREDRKECNKVKISIEGSFKFVMICPRQTCLHPKICIFLRYWRLSTILICHPRLNSF